MTEGNPLIAVLRCFPRLNWVNTAASCSSVIACNFLVVRFLIFSWSYCTFFFRRSPSDDFLTDLTRSIFVVPVRLLRPFHHSFHGDTRIDFLFVVLKMHQRDWMDSQSNSNHELRSSTCLFSWSLLPIHDHCFDAHFRLTKPHELFLSLSIKWDVENKKTTTTKKRVQTFQSTRVPIGFRFRLVGRCRRWSSMHFFVYWTGNWRRWARNRRRSLTWRPATAAQRPSATSAPNSTANVRATPSGRPSNQPPTPVSLEGGGSRPPPMGRDPRERERERERERDRGRPLSVGRVDLFLGRDPCRWVADPPPHPDNYLLLFFFWRCWPPLIYSQRVADRMCFCIVRVGFVCFVLFFFNLIFLRSPWGSTFTTVYIFIIWNGCCIWPMRHPPSLSVA